MAAPGKPIAFRLYLAFLVALLAVFGVAAVELSSGTEAGLAVWIGVVALFGLAEAVPLHFHHESGRQSLGAGEALLVPMLVALSLSQLFFGVVAVMGAIAVLYWRQGFVKTIFNVTQYGCAATASGLMFEGLGGRHGAFDLRTAAVAIAAVLLYAFLNHAFVAAAIGLSEKKPIFSLLKSVAPAAQGSLGSNIAIGLLFAASYPAGDWTVALFVFPLAALYFGYRAILSQARERERVENLHAASRALASSPNLDEALAGFLRASKEIVSSSEALAVVNVNRGWLVSRVHGSHLTQDMEPLTDGPLLELVEKLRADRQAVVVSDEEGADAELAHSMGVRSLVAVALVDGDEYAGCLAAADRVGVEEFSDRDARLLEALANELVLTLDSYRLFSQVAEERERFEQIFAGSKEGICLLDEEGLIRAWNPALARITGFDEQEVIGERWSERILVRDRHHRRIEGMEITRVSPDEELELVTREGPPRWVAIISGEVQAEDAKSWVLLVRDMTTEHELEESKSDFLSTVSHELRTPLTTIKGSLQVLSRPDISAQSDIGKQMIDIMRRGSDRLERLVMNLLAVSQMETGDVQVYPDEIELEELVRARINRMLADHPQVDLQVDEKVVVRADRERLAQAVEHLLDNARKFGPESGRIGVRIAKENGYAVVSVSDEGPGIPQIDQERIFERFVRLGHVLTRETQGPGVGLFIVKRSIEAMGGSVEVESEPNGTGSTFHLRIPLAHPMAAVGSTSA